MRKYFSGTGVLSVITSAIALLKGMRGQKFTWRTAIAWLSWGLTVAMSIGVFSENRRTAHGVVIERPEQSKEERKLLKRYR